MKKFFAMLLVLVMVLSLVACGGGNTDAASSDGTQSGGATASGGSSGGNSGGAGTSTNNRKEISVATTSDYGTLHAMNTPASGLSPVFCIQEPLFEMGADGTIRECLATGYEWLDDEHTHMIIHLREGVTFSNGNAFTADDVIFTYQEMVASGGLFAFAKVASIDTAKLTAIDDYTLDMWLNGPSSKHFGCLSSALIFDKESYDAEACATNPIGTGPYVLEEYVVNSHSVVTRRDDYWGELPQLEKITFRVIVESSQRVNAVETGLVEVAPVPLADVDYVSGLKNVKITSKGGYGACVYFNTSSDCTLGTPEARQAICHAIDQQGIASIVYYGKATPGVSSFPVSCMDFEDRMLNLGAYKDGFNIDLAKKMAEEQGLVGKTLIIVNGGSTEHVQISEMLQGMLEEIGIKCEIRSYDASAFQTVLGEKESFDIAVSTMAVVNNMVCDWLVGSVRGHRIYSLAENWPDGVYDRYDAIRDLCYSEPDDAKRKEIIYECVEAWENNCISYMLCEYQTYYAFPDDFDEANYMERTSAIKYAKDFMFK